MYFFIDVNIILMNILNIFYNTHIITTGDPALCRIACYYIIFLLILFFEKAGL